VTMVIMVDVRMIMFMTSVRMIVRHPVTVTVVAAGVAEIVLLQMPSRWMEHLVVVSMRITHLLSMVVSVSVLMPVVMSFHQQMRNRVENNVAKEAS
jgi:hypothetical protein